MMAAGRLALLCLGLTFLWTEVASQRHQRCQPFHWPNGLDGDLVDPVGSNRGSVVLVALMKGYCGYCVVQAEGLQDLREHLARFGMPNISMTIINGGEPISRDNIANLQEASDIPVIQDDESHTLFTHFGGRKDDFIVYDRCGNRAAFIPQRYSYLGHTITERILRAVYRGQHRCPCPLDDQDRMQGDQPLEARYGLTNGINNDGLDLECPDDDRWCRSYMRRSRNNRLEHSRISNRPRTRPFFQQGNCRNGNCHRRNHHRGRERGSGTHHGRRTGHGFGSHRGRGHGLGSHHRNQHGSYHQALNHEQVMQHFGLSRNGGL